MPFMPWLSTGHLPPDRGRDPDPVRFHRPATPELCRTRWLSWATQEAELQRILETRSRFIFVEQGVFYAQLAAPVRALLDERLARAYRLLKSYPAHGIHALYPFERFVMNGAASAKLYELAAPALRYVPLRLIRRLVYA